MKLYIQTVYISHSIYKHSTVVLVIDIIETYCLNSKACYTMPNTCKSLWDSEVKRTDAIHV